MNPVFATTERFTLAVQMRCVDMLVDDELLEPANFSAATQQLLEPGLTALRMSYRFAAKELQNDREVAKYPATRWGHFMHSIGLGRLVRWTHVRVNECLAFPKIKIPPELYKLGSTICYDFRHLDLPPVWDVFKTAPKGGTE